MSSSQGGNSGTVTPGYTYDADSISDASEWTKQLKEKRYYSAYKSSTTDNKNTEDPWLKYSNQSRYTFVLGRYKCGSCNGPLFAQNEYYWLITARDSDRAWSSVAASSDFTKLVATVSPGYIYTSTDSGVTWTEQTLSGSRAWTAVTSSADGTKLAAVVNGGYIYTSADSGATWTEQTLSGTRAWTDIVSSDDGTRLSATVSTGYIYTSADSGSNWTERTGSGSRAWSSISNSYTGARLLATHGTIVAPTTTAYTSMNSGGAWTPRTVSLVNFPWAASDCSSDASTAYVSASQGVAMYKSTDSGVSWVPLSGSPGSVTSLACSNNGTVVIATKSGINLYISMDGGLTWKTYESNRSWSSVAISSDGRQFAATDNTGKIYIGTYTY